MNPRRLVHLLITLVALVPGASRALEVAHVNVGVNDVAYCRQDGFLYASVAGSDPTYGNRIVRIDPQNAQVVASLNIGSEPGKLAISDDGTALYVALGGAPAVRRVDLVNLTAGAQFTLGSDPFFGPYYAEDLSVQPGHPDVVLVSLKNLGISPRHAGVAVYENGVARAQRTPRHTGSNRIEFSADPGRAYGYNNETTEFGFRRLIVDASGVRELDVAGNVLSGFGIDITFDQGRIYSSTGQVLNPETKTLVGTFPLPAFSFERTMVPDGTRAYFLTNGELHEFDSQTFTSILRQGTGVPGVATVVVRWGIDGLAFRAVASGPAGLVILRRIHEPPAADLSLSMTESSDPVTIGFPFNYTLTVRNAGPQPASDVVVRDHRPPSAPFSYAFSSRGSCTDSAGTVVCRLGSIGAGDSATITLGLQAQSIGSLLNEATVVSATLDSNLANNHAEEHTEVTPPPSADFFVRLSRKPDPATVGLPIEFELLVGNRGPSPASMTWGCQFFDLPVNILSVDSPRGNCGASLFCDAGVVAPGDSFVVRIRAIPLVRGTLTTNAFSQSPVFDPNPQDDVVSDVLRVLPAVTQLLNDLVVLVQSYELKPGNEHVLVKRLRDARDAVAARDTADACSQLGQFTTHVNNMAGRGLTLEQAAAMLPLVEDVNEVLSCVQPRAAHRSAVQPGGGGPSTGETAATTGSEGREGAAPGHPRLNGANLLFALTSDANVQVELLDLQGRRLEATSRGRLHAGQHSMQWSRAPNALAPGIYFVRLSIDGEPTTLRHVSLR